MCAELLKMAIEVGEISDEAHRKLAQAVEHCKTAEEWQLKSQLKHAGKNTSTDTQIAIAKVALPALEEAVLALSSDDYQAVLDGLELAVTTDGKAPARKRRKAS